MESWVVSKLQCVFLFFRKGPLKIPRYSARIGGFLVGTVKFGGVQGAIIHMTRLAYFLSIPCQKKFCYLQLFLPFVSNIHDSVSYNHACHPDFFLNFGSFRLT